MFLYYCSPHHTIESNKRGHFADRRGLADANRRDVDLQRGHTGLPDIRAESDITNRRERTYRSRSPEKKVPLNLDPINSSASSRRNEYLKGDTKRDRKVRF